MICSAICSTSLWWPSRNAVGAWLAMSQRVNTIAFAVLLASLPASAWCASQENRRVHYA
jgi:hypothetical protein